MKKLFVFIIAIMPLYVFGQSVEDLNKKAWQLRNKAQTEAIGYANEAISLAQHNGDKAGEAEANTTLGLIHMEQKGDYASAKTFLHNAARLYESINDQNKLSLIYNKLGVLFSDLQQYSQAIDYFQKELALLLNLNDREAVAIAHLNIGILFSYQNKHQESINYFQKALEYAQSASDKVETARYHNRIGAAYGKAGNYIKSESHLKKAENLAIQTSEKALLADIYKNLAEMYMKKGDTQKALQYNEDYTAMRNTIINEQSVKVVDVISEQKEKEKQQVQSALANEQSKVQQKDEELSQKANEVISLSEENEVLEVTKAVLEKDKATLEQEKIMTQLELDYQIKLRNYLLIGLAIFMVLGLVILLQNRRQRKTNRELAKKKAEIESQKKRSDDLLLNILPAKTAEELKQKGKVAAKYYDQVTVLFTDFKDFTKVSETLSPEELVKLMDRYFSEFDRIIKKHNVEKIKTIGDAYMCAGGLPEINETHALDIANAALEIQQYIKRENQVRKEENKPVLPIRLGINTGPLVAGVVGINKFQYDIWGDTVNTAARMESGSQEGKINISGNTYKLIKHKFNCVYRGKIDAKNKGQIDMYFLEGIASKVASSEVKGFKGESVKLSESQSKA